MTANKTAFTAGITAVCAAAVLGIAAAPQIASAAASCTVTKTHAVHKVTHKRIHRPVAVAAYREVAPARVTRTVVETRYVREPVVVDEGPAYYGGYAPYPVYYGGYYGPYYHRHYGYGYGRPVIGIGIGVGHRHW